MIMRNLGKLAGHIVWEADTARISSDVHARDRLICGPCI